MQMKWRKLSTRDIKLAKGLYCSKQKHIILSWVHVSLRYNTVLHTNTFTLVVC